MTKHRTAALKQSGRQQKFSFDPHTYTIRRNLMVVASLAIISTFITPLENSGTYEINMGIIKGQIIDPSLLYVFLATTCLYYFVWFYIHCKSLVPKNYEDIINSFMHALSIELATAKFHELRARFASNCPAVTNFLSKGGYAGKWMAQATFVKANMPNCSEMLDSFRSGDVFEVIENEEHIKLTYVHNETMEDLPFLHAHMDRYWRTRKEEMFVSLLPMFYAALSLILLAYHIYGLYGSQLMSAT